MNRISPRVLGILVVAGGVCAALPYKRLATRQAAPRPEESAEAIEWRSQDFTLEVTGREPLSTSLEPGSRPKSPAFGSPQTAVKATPVVDLDSATQPPALPGEYDVAESSTSPTSQTASAAAGGSGLPGGDPGRGAASITHTITDGDTLEGLAEKHLGSRLRWTEIYNANPEILNDPEVLPLGVTIVILPRLQPAPPAATPEEADALVPVSSTDLLKFRGAND